MRGTDRQWTAVVDSSGHSDTEARDGILRGTNCVHPVENSSGRNDTGEQEVKCEKLTDSEEALGENCGYSDTEQQTVQYEVLTQ